MKQIRVTSPFLDITCSNKRREVGDIFLATQERAAYLVSGQLCEYVKDEDENKETPQTPANGEQNGQQTEEQNGQQTEEQTEEQTADNGSTVAPAEEQQSEEQQQSEGEGESAKDETPAEEQQQTDGEQPTDEGKATETKKTTKSKKEKK